MTVLTYSGVTFLYRLFAVLALGALSLVSSACGRIIRTTPDHAIVFVNDRDSTYAAPVCVVDTTGWRPVTAKQARKMQYRPEKTCRERDGFVQEGRTLPGALLEKIGVLKPLPSRWNEDGTWNW